MLRAKTKTKQQSNKATKGEMNSQDCNRNKKKKQKEKKIKCPNLQKINNEQQASNQPTNQ